MKSIDYIKEYSQKMKEIQELILNFLDNDDDQEAQYNNLIKLINDQKIPSDKQGLRTILHLISKICDNYHRSKHFFNKIEKVIKNYQNEIKNNFSNYEIFNIFKNNKRILLFLFEEKIVIPDKSLSWIISHGKFYDQKYPQYFYTEFKSFYDESLIKEITSSTTEIQNDDFETFEINRKSGENDNYICKLIQKDLVEKFVSFYTRTNFSLSSTIEPSIYETNAFLIDKKPSLIEYSAFFGSIQIFKFLFLNNVELTSSLWLYVIHGQCLDLIHFLEENHIRPQNETCNQCFDESIICHQVDIMNYIKNNFYEKEGENVFDLFCQSLRFYNFVDFCNNEYSFDDSLTFEMFYQLCKFDYVSLVDLLLKNKKIKLNERKVFKFCMF
ncbi:hypothetical protein M9Y10_027811 [Tritrichomonas musculus]|uniref:DUF3447 domain-containing protein n=1 Tax=Tritrichomonas musculus TaxID=1915356 RepID=A0ABR2H483_9EUKA